jgi:hypothetical protein
METIFAFSVHQLQTKNSATKIANWHHDHIIDPSSNKACYASRISPSSEEKEMFTPVDDRRRFLSEVSTILRSSGAAWMLTMAKPTVASAAGELPDQFNVDDYLKTGMVMNPMGVSGQAGKSKPITGM